MPLILFFITGACHVVSGDVINCRDVGLFHTPATGFVQKKPKTFAAVSGTRILQLNCARKQIMLPFNLYTSA